MLTMSLGILEESCNSEFHVHFSVECPSLLKNFECIQ